MPGERAYVVHDGDEGWAIVYATNGAAARRHGASELDCRFEEVASCRRAPTLDEYSVSTIPVTAILDLDWWTECFGCGRRMSYEDGEDWDHDTDERLPDLEPVGVWTKAWCTPTCRDDHLENELWKECAKEAAVEETTRLLLERLPGVTPGDTHAYVTDACRVEEVRVNFTFPGSRYGGHADSSLKDPTTYKRRTRWPGEPPWITFYVANGDQVAFRSYCDSLRWADPRLPRMTETTGEWL